MSMALISNVPGFNNVIRAHGVKAAIMLDKAMFNLNKQTAKFVNPFKESKTREVLLSIIGARVLYYAPVFDLFTTLKASSMPMDTVEEVFNSLERID